MKTKITLMLFALSFALCFSISAMEMPSPEEQEAVMAMMQQVDKALLMNIKREVKQFSVAQLDKLIKQAPYDAYSANLSEREGDNTELKGLVVRKLLAASKTEKQNIVARMMLNAMCHEIGVGIMLQEARGNGMLLDGMEDARDATDTTADQAQKSQKIPNDHVIIMPIKHAENLVERSEKRLRKRKSFAPSHIMLFRNLDMEKWNKSFESEEKWTKSLKERIEKAKKNPTEIIILGGTPADFEAAIEHDCQLVDDVVGIAAMELHIQKAAGKAPEGAPSIEKIFEELPSEEQQKERLKKHRDSAVGKIAIVRAFVPKKINDLLPPVSAFSKSPFLEHAKMIVAARKAAAKPAVAA